MSAQHVEPELTGEFPVIFEFRNLDLSSFIKWYKSKESELSEKLHSVGAILFRGLSIEHELDFERVIDEIGFKFLNYVDGNSPRTKISSKVYTSTEYDKDQFITLHNELSYSYSYPAKIYFCCTLPAASGGETPIADCRSILERMDEQLVNDLLRKGIIYIRNLNNGSGLGPSWQSTFETENKNEVEEFCEKTDTEFLWKEDGGIKLLQKRKGIILHPSTNELVWFNQIDQFHPSHLPAEIYDYLMMMCKNDTSELPMYVTYGDGSLIDNQTITKIRETVDNASVCFSWEKGDLLMLDNILVAHGRRPYEGNRKVLVAMSN